MSKRKSLPQIDDLINPASQHSPPPPPLPQTPKENKKSNIQDDKNSSRQKTKNSSGRKKKAPKEKKEQLTIYLDSDIAYRLDSSQLKLRRLTGKKGFATSRSAIIERAIILALNDLDANGIHSNLASLISRD